MEPGCIQKSGTWTFSYWSLVDQKFPYFANYSQGRKCVSFGDKIQANFYCLLNSCMRACAMIGYPAKSLPLYRRILG